MNAPLPESVRLALEQVTLDDKYALERGRAFMSGVQALVRLPMLQRARDAANGLQTAGFVSGYRGSPLGGYDQALWQAQKHLAAQQVVFQPGVNEELAATAVWGTQMLDLYPQSKKFDGVFGLWYGKGPGVDRCSDVFKHANMAGTSAHGGVIAVAGDDHVAKSSTAAHQSDHIFKACGFPVFFPSDVQGILDMGLHAWAMSRFSGVWTGLKTIQEVVESSSSVIVDPDRVQIVLPQDFVMPAGGVHMRWPDTALDQEARLMDYKWYAALAYVRANRLNYNVVEGPHDRLGLIASGKAFNDTRQALSDLGLSDEVCRQLGVRVHKVNVVWPLEATITRDFASGLQEILVIEEKRQIIEYQLKEELYNWRPDVRPNVLGKFNEQEGDASGGEWSMPNPSDNTLLRAKADLSPSIIAKAIASRLKKLGVPADIAQRMDARLAVIAAKEQSLAAATAQSVERTPWFCSGCPHNTSTRVPEGSRAVAGIGCHFMATWMNRSTVTFSQMGGEGVSWVGQAPFSKDTHIFANLGDGTYYHSGLLAVRQAIAAKVNITYKILFNDAVAMTGGQPVDGTLGVPAMTRELEAEGVRQIVVVTDEPEKYDGVTGLAPGVTVRHRDELDAVQRHLREVPGCTALIYDQTCATEKRRRRKRGKMATPAKTVLINEAVCEGCGDCSVQSNCLSVETVSTEFGRKRRVNQSTCNKDFSCLKGFCPSFVTVEGGTLKKAAPSPKTGVTMPAVPEPVLPDCEEAWGIVVGGVGGTGVITIGQLLGMAAHLDGKGIVTQDAGGLAQKGGATWSHVQIAQRPERLFSTKVDTAKANLVIGCDTIVAANRATLSVMQSGRTYVALNTHGTPTAALLQNADWEFPQARCETALQAVVGPQAIGAFDAEEVAVQLLGDSIYTNPMMLGYAWQKGQVPLSHASLMRAIELNGVQVQNNQAAFEWGRRCAHDLSAVRALFQARQVIEFVKKPSLDELVERRVQFLQAYQNAAYAERYRSFVQRVRQAEAQGVGQGTRLSEAVAHNLFKLMAYKDEYEVARLHTDPAFAQRIAGLFEGDYRVVHHLAPPAFSKRNDKGELQKRAFGPWIRPALALLAHLKGLRGTAFDPFGYTAERRCERQWIVDYQQALEMVMSQLTADRLDLACDIARIAQDIRGFGHVKERYQSAARHKFDTLLAQWRALNTSATSPRSA
ncbi:MAG: indolepyruvate ferredoxin oxidoreductase family protein [Betaproteobacteria bacterium]|nr:indolepyruvate ferredoxin oxidoreductase family protein [Betaproteobacteria bacterium]